MRIAINGYGRVGRCVLRALFERDDCSALKVVAINELAKPSAIAYLTQYDSTHGRFAAEITQRTDASGHEAALEITNQHRSDKIKLLEEARINQLNWANLDVDFVFDCSGVVSTQATARQHLEAGAKNVLLSNPGEPPIPAIVFGVNHSTLTAADKIISAASCTSNALAPTLAVLHKAFGINNGVVTTIHASMHDQPVIDAYHSDDLRKNRAASQSIIPVATELAAGIGRVLPELSGKFVAHALRVPVNNVSAINVTVNLNTDVSVADINAVIKQQALQLPDGVLGYTEEPLASCDFNHDARSGIVDTNQTQLSDKNTANLLIWFDNEWAFANRMLDLALHLTRHKTAP